MPVIDHAIHPSTQRGAGHRYACHNRDGFAIGYMAPNRVYDQSGHFEVTQKFIFHEMSTECRFDMSLSDPYCADCRHQGSGERYAASIRSQAK